RPAQIFTFELGLVDAFALEHTRMLVDYYSRHFNRSCRISIQHPRRRRNNGREYYNYTMLETLASLFETKEIIISPETLKRSTPISRISNHTIINSIESILTKLSTLDR
ncbi:hypothetical protein, partial [uncultured Sutterella sp.]|uniref:hypothetical protein n=1 Tax=uncultured Sutterella sp. TaxID=286133 RepID=UPI0025F11F40